MKKQLLNFKRVVVHPNRGFQLPKIVYTGKFKGGQDDVVMALTMAIFFTIEFCTERLEGVPYDMFDGTS